MWGHVFWFLQPLSHSRGSDPLKGACAADRPGARLLKTAAAPGLRVSGRLGGGTSRAPLLQVWAGLPGLLGHLTQPADASFWSELVATWAPISETQIVCPSILAPISETQIIRPSILAPISETQIICPSILQKPRRACGQPGLLLVFHGRILSPSMRAPTAAADHRPTRGHLR